MALHRGIQLAAEEANRGGPIRVSVATRDDEGKPERAVAAAEELVTRLRVAALVGGYVDTLVAPLARSRNGTRCRTWPRRPWTSV